MGRVWGALTAAGLCLMGLSAVPGRVPHLLYNATESAPTGWYRLHASAQVDVGDRVAAHLPDRLAAYADTRGYLPRGVPVIKTVWAVSGDTYCIESGAMRVAGRPALFISSTDGNGLALPVLMGGCRRVPDGHVLLASDYSTGSFDGRYFGPIDQELVLGHADYLGEIGDLFDWDIRFVGGARGLGAEGKIKGSRAARGLTPCLHIDFYGAPNLGVERYFGEMPYNTRVKEGALSRGFTASHERGCG